MGGDLRALLRADKQLPEPTVLRFGRDLAAALQHLHSIGTLHCDLNPSNLLLDENGRVKLGGFSLSRRNGDAAAGAAGVPAGQVCLANLERLARPHSMSPCLWCITCIIPHSCVQQRSSNLWFMGLTCQQARAGGREFPPCTV